MNKTRRATWQTMSRQTGAWILSSLASVAAASAISGSEIPPIAGAGLLFEPDHNNIVQPAPMVSSLVDLKVSGVVARGRVQQFFYNPSDQWQSGVYVFPLPENAAVDGFRIRIGELAMEGQIAEREEAEATFDQAQRDGVRASLLNQDRPDVFTLAVANIGPGEEIEVELELQFEVRFDVDRFRLRFPLLAAERYDLGRSGCQPKSGVMLASYPAPKLPPTVPADFEQTNPVALRVDLHGGSLRSRSSSGTPLSSITSPTHNIDVQQHGLDTTVELADGLTPADGDFVLEWTPVADHLPHVSLTLEQLEDATYGLLMVMPPAAGDEVRLPREAIFVVDTSGSMEGIALQQARDALSLALRDLQPFDRFNLIRFSDQPARLFPQAVVAEPEAITAAEAWVAELAVEGGTHMLPALAAALETSEVDDGLVRQVIFITDGRVSNELELFAYLRQHLGSSRLFTVGLGSAPNGSFMRRAAELGRGTHTFIPDIHQTRRQMTTLLRKLSAPVLSNLEVWWDDPGAQTWPERPGDLYVGEPLVLVTRFDDPQGEVHLAGQVRGVPWSLDLPLVGLQASTTITHGRGIAKLWARRQVSALMDPFTAHLDPSSPTIEEARRQVVELALDHRLMTPFTSFIAVDVSPGAPTGEPIPMRPIPRLSPRNTAVTTASLAPPGSLVSEELIVTSQIPLINTGVACLALAPTIDLDLLPNANKPWSWVSLAPGTVLDRPPIDAVEPPGISGRGAVDSQTVVRLDNFDITDDTASEPSFELRGLPLEDVVVASGGGESSLSTAGLQIDLRSKNGTNNWQGDAYTLSSRSDDTPNGDQMKHFSATSFELGGPVHRDRVWAWAALADTAVDRQVIGGQRVDADLLHTTGKLQAAFGRYSLEGSWHRGDTAEDGRGAGPDRAPTATWDHRGQTELWQVQGSAAPTPYLYVSGGSGGLERRVDDRPYNGFGGNIFTDSAGVTHGSAFGRTSDRRTHEHRLGGNAFHSFSGWSNELSFGARLRSHEADTSWASGQGMAIEAGDNLGLDPGLALLSDWQDARERRDLDQIGTWLQSELTGERLTWFLGLRHDQQQGESLVFMDTGLATAAADWQSWAPRLGFTAGLGGSQRSLLRVAFGRFAGRLATSLARRLATSLTRRLGTGVPVADRQLFGDTDGDLAFDLNEPFQPWLARRPGRFSPDLGPELTDELLLSFEHELNRGLATGLTLTHRRTRHVLERRMLVRGTTGEVFQATTDDWVQAGSVSGQLPNGGVYNVPFFDLRPGLEGVPFSLWVNGDRQQETLAASLTLHGRLSDRIWLNGHLSWNDSQWRIGQQFLRFDDPTDTVGSGDDPGERVVDFATPDLLANQRAIDSRWSFHLSTVLELPWSLDLGIVANGRQGFPLPYHRRVARDAAGITAIELTQSVDAIRTTNVLTLDARLTKQFDVDWIDLALSLEAFNLLGANDVLQRETDLGVGRGGAVNERIASRSFRFGARIGWR